MRHHAPTYTPDQQAALTELTEVAKALKRNRERRKTALTHLHQLMAASDGLPGMTAPAVAQAANKDRKYVNSIRSRTPASIPSDFPTPTLAAVTKAANVYRKFDAKVTELMDKRDELITRHYLSGLLLPTPIADAVGIYRNHVMAIARMSPDWTPRPRTQYGARPAMHGDHRTPSHPAN